MVQYFDNNGEHFFSVYALGIGTLQDGSGDGQPDEVLNLGLVVELVSDTGFSWPTTPYTPTTLQLVLLPEEEALVDPEFINVLPWPFDGVTLDDFDSNGFLGCTTIEGTPAANAIAALATANSVTIYRLDAQEHRVLARPLLPGEPGCAMLG